MAKHFRLAITLSITRDQQNIDAETVLDGIHVLRSTVTGDDLGAGVVGVDKNLAGVERDFKSVKAIDIDLRPVHHHLEHRVRAHVFLCFLAGHLTHHLRRTLAELTHTDETPPTREDPVAPAATSQAAHDKTNNRTSTDGLPLNSNQGLLGHLATLTGNDLHYGTGGPVIPTLAEPTPVRRRVFQLIGAPIPATLT